MLKLKVFTMPSTGRQLLVAALVTLGLLAGYHSVVYSEGEPDSEVLDAMADAARSALLDEQPDLSARLKELPGYAVIAMSAAKLPGVGAGQGYGVVVDNRNQQRLLAFEIIVHQPFGNTCMPGKLSNGAVAVTFSGE